MQIILSCIETKFQSNQNFNEKKADFPLYLISIHKNNTAWVQIF